ncbi:MAG: hypothetical protein Q9181_007759, partial [Wetmoreana brouardii]
MAMAANREERFLMRQRGAGTRDIQLSFDLELPGLPKISRSPLKPQRSARSSKFAQIGPLPSLATRQTPKITKTNPTLSSRRTPATARKRQPKAMVTDRVAAEKEIALDAPNQRDKETTLTKKRKAAPESMEAIEEISHTSPPRKRRKRRSIGQQSLRTKKKALPASKASLQISRPSLSSEPLVDQAKVMAEQPLKVGKEKRDATEVHRNVGDAIIPHVPQPPKRRKRKSIGQIQGPKKRLKPLLQDFEEEKPELAGVDSEAADGQHPQEDLSIDENVTAKPERQKRKRTVQGSKERKEPHEEAPLPAKTESERSLASKQKASTLVKAATISPSKEKPTKRGRKPRTLSDNEAKPVIEYVESVQGVVDPEAAQGEPPSPATTKLKPEEKLAPPKRKRKKRISITQDRRSRKKAAASPPAVIVVGHEPIDSDIERTEVATNTKIARKPQGRGRRQKKPLLSLDGIDTASAGPEHNSSKPAQEAPKKRGRPKKSQVSPTEVKTDLAGPNHDEAGPAPTAKKRGRPKKAILSDSEAKPLAATQQPTGAMNQATASKRRQPKACIAVTISPELQSLPEEAKALDAAPNPELPPLPVAKKRGRPKKQLPIPPAVEPSTTATQSSQPKPKPNVSATLPDSSISDASKTSVNPISAINAHSIRTSISREDDGDVSDDPISESKPLRAISKRTSRNNEMPMKRVIQEHVPTISQQLDVAAREHIDVEPAQRPRKGKRTFEEGAVETAPQLLNPDTQLEDARPQQPSHNEADDETQTLKNDLRTLHAQRAAEIAEQKERDLQSRLESLSASIKKRRTDKPMAANARKLNGDRLLNTDTEMTRKEKVKRPGRELEGFLFKRVERKGRVDPGAGA